MRPVPSMVMLAVSASVVAVIACNRPMAGQLTYVDGKGTWTSTECAAPVPPASDFADAAAVNAAVYQLTAAVNTYNKCLHEEVQRDLMQSNTAAIDTVRRLQGDAVAAIARYRQRLAEQPPASPPAAKP